MARANRTPAEPLVYVLLADQELPPDQRSTFTFRPLTQAERMMMTDGMTWLVTDASGRYQLAPRASAQARELVLTTLTKVENFPIDGAQAWPKQREEQEKYLALINDDDVVEMGDAVRRSAIVEKGDPTKNS